ncbi:MAG: hypothetical protein GY721_13510 [Deltaproteobacteria bacterium]|jgi:hypothetical protein|nr:hypothetical protein [Deltaproteobacteria bacterium]
MGQTAKVRGVATSIRTADKVTSIRYHNTDVVEFSDKEIILNSGGWQTATTKTRMNQAANQFDLGYTVYQTKGEWFVGYKGKDLKFTDKMILER